MFNKVIIANLHELYNEIWKKILLPVWQKEIRLKYV